MENTIKRFPKGHRVVCAMPLSYQGKLPGDCPCTVLEDKILVEAFVTGDTPEKGLSLVALENPDWCLYSSKEYHPKVRAAFEKGFWDCWITGNYCDAEVDHGVNPTCAYK